MTKIFKSFVFYCYFWRVTEISAGYYYCQLFLYRLTIFLPTITDVDFLGCTCVWGEIFPTEILPMKEWIIWFISSIKFDLNLGDILYWRIFNDFQKNITLFEEILKFKGHQRKELELMTEQIFLCKFTDYGLIGSISSPPFPHRYAPGRVLFKEKSYALYFKTPRLSEQ